MVSIAASVRTHTGVLTADIPGIHQQPEIRLVRLFPFSLLPRSIASQSPTSNPPNDSPISQSRSHPLSESCIKGHRSSSCAHTDRPLYEIKKKGRPVSQCERCRELRSTKRVHSKCTCSDARTSRSHEAEKSFGTKRELISVHLPMRWADPSQFHSSRPIACRKAIHSYRARLAQRPQGRFGAQLSTCAPA